MSSLQKFHRRTMSLGPVMMFGSEAPIVGSGFYLGNTGDGVYKLIVAPKSTEVMVEWGSSGTFRGTTSTSNGINNTNTLYAFGSAAHPAAYYTKTLTTGGYNTWYMPAIDELRSCFSNCYASPFYPNDTFKLGGHITQSSTEYDASRRYYMAAGTSSGPYAPGYYRKNDTGAPVRAVRRI